MVVYVVHALVFCFLLFVFALLFLYAGCPFVKIYILYAGCPFVKIYLLYAGCPFVKNLYFVCWLSLC